MHGKRDSVKDILLISRTFDFTQRALRSEGGEGGIERKGGDSKIGVHLVSIRSES